MLYIFRTTFSKNTSSGDGWFMVIEDVFGLFKVVSVICSFSSYGEFRCSKSKRIRQLCRAFVVSSNNDAKVPFKQMTKFLGNHHIKSHLKRLWVGERSFVLWKLTYIALYKFSPFWLCFSPFWGNLAYYLAYYCLAGLYPRLSTWQIFLFIENLL